MLHRSLRAEPWTWRQSGATPTRSTSSSGTVLDKREKELALAHLKISKMMENMKASLP